MSHSGSGLRCNYCILSYDYCPVYLLPDAMSRYGPSPHPLLSFLTIVLLLLGPVRPALAQDAPTQDDLPQAEALFPATLQGMERESASKQTRNLAVVANATYLDASTDAQAVLNLMVVDASIASLYPTEIHDDQKLVRRLASNPDDLEEITVDDQTAYLEPDDDEGGLVAYVPLDAYAVLTVRQCCGRAEQDLRALIAALDMQQFRSAATAYAEADHNAELRSLLMAAPSSIGGYPLRSHEIHGESGLYLIELFYSTTESPGDEIGIMMGASVSPVPTGEIAMGMFGPNYFARGLEEGWITQTTLAGHDAYLQKDKGDLTMVVVTDGAHAFFSAGGPTNVISLETLLEDLTEARIEAFFAGVETVVAE